MIVLNPYHVIHEAYGGGKIEWEACFRNRGDAELYCARRMNEGKLGTYVIANVTDNYTMEPPYNKRETA